MTQPAQRMFLDFLGNARRTNERVVVLRVLGRVRRTMRLA